MRDPLPKPVQEAFKQAMHQEKSKSELDEIDFTPAGHGGSHPYLVHEFASAVFEDRTPAISAWDAARYMAMGVTAHQSALKDSTWLDVPDWGDAPRERKT